MWLGRFYMIRTQTYPGIERWWPEVPVPELSASLQASSSSWNQRNKEKNTEKTHRTWKRHTYIKVLTWIIFYQIIFHKNKNKQQISRSFSFSSWYIPKNYFTTITQLIIGFYPTIAFRVFYNHKHQYRCHFSLISIESPLVLT